MATHEYSPHIKRVLKSYQSSAKKGLHGPSSYISSEVVSDTKNELLTCCKESTTTVQRQALLQTSQYCYVSSSKQHDASKCYPHDLSLKGYLPTYNANSSNTIPYNNDTKESYNNESKGIDNDPKGYGTSEIQRLSSSKSKKYRYSLTDDPAEVKYDCPSTEGGKEQQSISKSHLFEHGTSENSATNNATCHADLGNCGKYSKCYETGSSEESDGKWQQQQSCHKDSAVYQTTANPCSPAPNTAHIWAEPFTPPSPYSPVSHGSPPQAPFPLVMGHADEYGGKGEVLLEGQKVACFNVGGEQRLCFVQVLYTSLKNISITEINRELQSLQIYLSFCSSRQLQRLKEAAVLPPVAKTCGLITYSDAHRLTHALLHATALPDDPPKFVSVPYSSFSHQFTSTNQHLQQQATISAQLSNNQLTPNMIVSHRCFGKCRGWVYLCLYQHPESKCVQCCECRVFYTPGQFVCHAHRSLETRTCHWGFDPGNWRMYLQLASDQPLPASGSTPQHLPETALDLFKTKFEPTAITSVNNKPKQVSNSRNVY